MRAFKIFIVEDDKLYGELLHYHLQMNPDYEVHLFYSGKECLAHLHEKPDVITIDYTLPDMSGEELMKKAKLQLPDTRIVIISGQEEVKIAIRLMQEGAYDYIVKDEDTNNRLWNAVLKVKENVSLKIENEQLKEEIHQKYDFRSAIIGNSPEMNRIFALIEKAAKSAINVIITGEIGTGKELIAKSIHYNSDRKKKKFVAINMAAIPSELMESELFGFEKGAFTGAISKRVGLFEEANGGTIFLDEIAELSLPLQSKILRVLQEKEITRVGGNGSLKIDVRLVVATHKNLKEEKDKGNFREDLYYRLLGLTIELPPLRSRGNDILLLAKYFSDVYCTENNMKKIAIATKAKEKLLSYHYPGNVRELKAIMDLAVVMSNGQVIESEDITFSNSQSISELLMSEELTLKAFMQKIIKHYLDKYDQNVLLVAKKLDIGKSTIYRMLQNGEI